MDYKTKNLRIMKKQFLVFLIICLVMSATDLAAQHSRRLNHYNGSNVVKLDLSAAVQRELSLSYERQLSKWLTWEVGGSYAQLGNAPSNANVAASSTYTEYVKRETFWILFFPSTTTTRYYIGDGRPLNVAGEERTHKLDALNANTGLRFYFKPALTKRAIPQGFYTGIHLWGGQVRDVTHSYREETAVLESDGDLDIWGLPIILVGATTSEVTTTYRQTVTPVTGYDAYFLYGVRHSLGWQWIAPSGFTLELQTSVGLSDADRIDKVDETVSLNGHIRIGWAF